MSAQSTTQVLSHTSDKANVKRIWKAFWILLILTLIELGLGLLIFQLDKGNPSDTLILFIKGVITILTLVKAFYIISIFMHLGDEKRTLIFSIAIPSMLFIWFIIAFLADGESFKTLRNTNAGSRPFIEQSIQHHTPAAMPATKSNKKLD